MATYAIGDIQGCFSELKALIEKLAFDPTCDYLWFVGDLVNRGPASLDVLRYVKSLGERAITVLGNHDLHLLACRYSSTRKPKPLDTLDEVLAADDCDELLNWLRFRPLIHTDPGLRFTLVHAGLPREWLLADALRYAREAETALRGKQFKTFLRDMYGNGPSLWRPDLAGAQRLRFITNSLTRIRYCTVDGSLDMKAKGALGTHVSALIPWFMLPDRKHRNERIIFGHWSTLHLAAAAAEKYNVYPLDTGAVWGGELTAMRLEDQTHFSVRGNTATLGEAD